MRVLLVGLRVMLERWRPSASRTSPEVTRIELERRPASRGDSFNTYLLDLLEQETAQAEVTRDVVLDAIHAGREERVADLMRAIQRPGSS